MKKKILISALILLVVGVSAYLAWGKKQEGQQYITTKVQKRDLVQTVKETGTVMSPKRTSLSFSATGKLAKKEVKVGDIVKKGEVLAELDRTSVLKEKQKTLSELETAKAELEKVLAGSPEETMEVRRSQVDQAKENYESSLEELEKTKEKVEEDIKQAEENLRDLTDDKEGEKTSYEQAVENAKLNLENIKKEHEQNITSAKESSLVIVTSKLSVANTALDSVNKILEEDDDIQSVFSAQSSRIERITEDKYEDSLRMKEVAVSALEKAKNNNTKENVLNALSKNIEYMNKVAETLDYCYQGLENTVTSSDFSPAELNSYKTEIDNMITRVNGVIDGLESSKRSLETAYLSYETALSSAKSQLEQARTNLEEAIRNTKDALATARLRGQEKITSLESKVKNAKESLEVAKRREEETGAGATQEEIDLARAKVRQAEDAVDIIEDRVSDYRIVSPITGKVVSFEPEIGEQIQAGEPVISVLGQNDYKVEVNIPETDINKIKEGDVAEITLDAFGEEEEFKGEVFFIDPDKTVIQDVVYYEVELKFINPGSDRMKRMRSGMTANISITTGEKENVLAVPTQAIIKKENKQGDRQKYVRVLKGEKDKKENPVQTGMRGDNGMIEIIEGVKEGEKVITYIKNK